MDRTADDLIRDSIEYDTTARAPYSPELAEALLLESDDSAEQSGEWVEFWGVYVDDQDRELPWRVQLDHPEVD